MKLSIGILVLVMFAGSALAKPPNKRPHNHQHHGGLPARVVALEDRVGTTDVEQATQDTRIEELETQVSDLEQQINLLGNPSHPGIKVIDDDGAQVGEVISGDTSAIRVMFFFDGLRPFSLRVHSLGFASVNDLTFASTDCSGTPLLEPLNVSEMMGRVTHIPSIGKTYVAPEGPGTLVTLLSRLDSDGSCQPMNSSPSFGDAVLIPEIEAFVPPFYVVPR